MRRLAAQAISSVALCVILVQRLQIGHGLILTSPVSAAPSRVAAFGRPLFPLHSCFRFKRCCRRDGVRSLYADLIKDIRAREIIDSRGNPTVEVDLTTETGTFRASVPSGASTGRYEALELRDGDRTRYMGKGVLAAIHNIHTKLLPAVLGMDPADQAAVDQRLIDTDGTAAKSAIGANALLAVSLAAAKAGAAALNRPIYLHIADLARRSGLERRSAKLLLPVPWFNVINGGAHAGNRLAVQEIMIAPVGAESFAEAMRVGTEVYHELRNIIVERYGALSASVGDEGGFAPDVASIEEALELVAVAVSRTPYEHLVKIGLDIAASEMALRHPNGTAITPHHYNMHPDEPPLSSAEMLALYQKLCSKYSIVSIEDGLDEDDWAAFSELTRVMGHRVQVVGDDLTVSNPVRIKRGLSAAACNALLLKVNQIGTVTEALNASALAYNAGWGVMVSHRSGETEDTFISDLVVGLSTGQIKSGAPCRSERVAKYNQLIRIEEELAADAIFAGNSILRTHAE